MSKKKYRKDTQYVNVKCPQHCNQALYNPGQEIECTMIVGGTEQTAQCWPYCYLRVGKRNMKYDLTSDGQTVSYENNNEKLG